MTICVFSTPGSVSHTVQSADERSTNRPLTRLVDQIMAMPERTKIQLLAPVVRGRKGEHVKVLEQARKSGYMRVRIDGNLYELSEEIKLEKNIKHNIDIIVDRLVVKEGIEKEGCWGYSRVVSPPAPPESVAPWSLAICHPWCFNRS